jgi:heme-degrading monooxygenase HmoA
MYARIATWRIAAEDYAALDREVAPVVAEIKAQPGYIAGYQLRSAPDTVMTITLWEDEANMEAAFAAAASKLGPLMQTGRMERLAVQSYPAEEWA